MLSDRCLSVLSCPVLSCLSVMLVYCDQMVGWIKMKLGMQVSLSPSDIVLDGDPALPPTRAQPPPQFLAHVLWPNGWMDQDDTWHVGRPRPRPHCARWGPSSPPQREGAHPHFWPMSVVAEQLDGSRHQLVRR